MQAADAAAVREGVRGRALEPGPGPGAFGDRAHDRPEVAGRTGDPIAVEHEVQDGEVLPFAGRRCARRATRWVTWRCCCPGTAACCSPATPPPTSGASASVRSTRTSTRGCAACARLAEPAVRDGAVRARAAARAAGLRALSRSLLPAGERAGRRRRGPAAQFAQESLVDAGAPRRIVSARVRDGRPARRGGSGDGQAPGTGRAADVHSVSGTAPRTLAGGASRGGAGRLGDCGRRRLLRLARAPRHHP